MRLPAWAAYPLQTIMLTACMAVVMSLALTIIRGGMVEGWIAAGLRNAAIAYPVALAATFLIGPPVRRFVAFLTTGPRWNSAAPGRRRARPRCRDRRKV